MGDDQVHRLAVSDLVMQDTRVTVVSSQLLQWEAVEVDFTVC